MRYGLIGLACGVALAGCGGATSDRATNSVAAATPTAPVASAPLAPAQAVADAWIGKWIGVEGLALDIAAARTPGTYKVHIALLDGAGDYVGTADGDVIRFTRDGVAETIRHTSGAETGLKWLADKTDCLTVKPGEGFCRD